MLVVIDTNVLVTGFRSRRGASFRLLTLLRSGAFEIAVSVPLVLEYEAVLSAHARELGMSADDVTGLVDYLCSAGRRQANSLSSTKCSAFTARYSAGLFSS